jgi:hypothetical protein
LNKKEGLCAVLRKLRGRLLVDSTAWLKSHMVGLAAVKSRSAGNLVNPRQLLRVWPAALLLACSLSQAQTSVSGSIAASTQWISGASPYVVTGSLTVDNGAVLTINPGVTVYMTAGAEIRIRSGKLLVSGLPDGLVNIQSDKIRQGISPAAGDWGQLVFEAGASGSSLHYIKVSHGKGLSITGAAVGLNNVNLTDHAGPAIAADLRSSLSGIGNQASGNLFNAVVVPAGEITVSTGFGLRGIPYLLQSGVLSVGAAPRIDSISPSVILAGDTATLTVSGGRLTGASAPAWSIAGLATEILPGATDSQLMLRVMANLAAAAGNADLSLQTDAGEVKKALALIVQRNQPRLNSVLPNSLLTGVGPSTLTLAGDFISPLSLVEVDGQLLQTTVDSASQARAVLPSQSASGDRTVRLRTPDSSATGTFLVSNALTLAVQQPQAVFEPASVSMIAGASQAVLLRLPFAAPQGGLAFVLTSSAPAVASTTASVVVSAGAVTATFAVQGVAVGAAEISASRSGWTATNLPVVVIVPPVTFAYTPVTSALVGLQVGSPSSTQTTVSFDSPLSPAVGVSVGSFASKTFPQVGVIDTRVALQISGAGLSQVTTITFVPPAGLAVGIPSVSANGQLLSVGIDIDANAPKTARRILLGTANGLVPFSDPAAAGFLVAAPPPELISVSPQIIVAGQPAKLLTVLGQKLRDISAVRFDPPQGITTTGAISVNPDGTSLTVLVQAPNNAVSGQRTVIVVAAGGESTAQPSPSNTLQVATEVRNFADLNSPLVGVVVGSAPVQTITWGPVFSDLIGVTVGSQTATTTPVDPLVSPVVGLLIGSGAFDLTPKAAIIGTVMSANVTGVGLNAVTSVKVLPGDGIVVGAPSVNAAGTSLSFSLSVSPQATLTLRRVVLQTSDPAKPTVPFLNDSRAQFLVAVVPPEFDSIEPQVVLAGTSSVTFTVRGRRLRDLSAVRFEPAQGLVQVTPPTVNTDGTVMQVKVQVLGNASSGPRTMIAVAAGGESASLPSPANTIYVAQQMGATFSDAASLPVGVMVGSVTVAAQSIDAHAPQIGVIVGPAITGMTPAGAIKASSGSLVFSGTGLAGVSSVTLKPPAPAGDITFGAPQVNGDGSSVVLPYSISANATSNTYRVGLSVPLGTGSVAVPSIDAGRQSWRVLDQPTILSFDPLVMRQGLAYVMTIRGSNLKEVTAIQVEPADGITVDPDSRLWGSDSFGEKLSVRLLLSPSASTGAHVLRLAYPGGSTSGQGSTNNTFSVTPP